MGKVELLLGGFLKADSRAKVLKVCLEQSGILNGRMAKRHTYGWPKKYILHNLRVLSKTRSAFEAPTK
jgi:hypothetical protein